MGKLSGDILQMIFRRVIDDHLKEVSLNGRLLSIFLYMDGERNLGAIAQAAQLNLSDLREAISRLLNLKLIEQVTDDSAFIDDEFIVYLTLQLAKAIGPLSKLLVEDSVQTAGYSVKRFPADSAGDLVETLAKEIQKEDKRQEFRKNLHYMIQRKGYDKLAHQHVQ